jgi:hypothetical protein
MSRESVLKLCGFGLIAACFAATSVYSYSLASTTIPVVGAAETNHDDCKNCSNNGTETIYECYDLSGPSEPCNDDFCGKNEFQFAQCEVGDAGAEETDCITEPDPDDWWRRLTVKDPTEDCTSEDDLSKPTPDCSAVLEGVPAGTPWTSPCGTDAAHCPNSAPTQHRVIYVPRQVCAD